MAQFLNFGNGSDGAATLSGTDAPIDSSCSGTAATTSLSATNASFAAGQIILIHQSRGTGVGQWELNQISSYVAGTITTTFPLANTYTDSGASQAQVLVVPQYSSVTINGTLTPKVWNQNVGGIITFMCSGKVTISGTLSTSESTFTGGQVPASNPGNAGEGTAGDGVANSSSANGNGGGGGVNTNGGGGGGGNGDAGTNGGGSGGTGGASVGSSDLTNACFGGGGGSGGSQSGSPAFGGKGGGAIFLFVNEIVGSGSLLANGGNGVAATNNSGGGGGGGGGSIFIKTRKDLGITTCTATGGSGGNGHGTGNAGGGGGAGRIRIESCSTLTSSTPSSSNQTGGFSFCTIKHGIL